MNKLPAFQFYPADWRKDPSVQSLSYFDRGVWFEILCLMHESEQRGKLLLNGKPMPDEALARLLGLDKQNLTKTLTTLLDYGVASRDEQGALINRRMVRDEQIRQIRTESGKKGGNPNLVNQNSTKPQKEVNQNSTSSSSFSSSKTHKDVSVIDGDEMLPKKFGNFRDQFEEWYCGVFGLRNLPPDIATIEQVKWLFQNKFTLSDIKAFYGYATTDPEQLSWRKSGVNLGAIVKGIVPWKQQKQGIVQIDYSKCLDCKGSGMIVLQGKTAKVCKHEKLKSAGF